MDISTDTLLTTAVILLALTQLIAIILVIGVLLRVRRLLQSWKRIQSNVDVMIYEISQKLKNRVSVLSILMYSLRGLKKITKRS